MAQHEAGKGSVQRPGRIPDGNWERTFGNPKPVQPVTPKPEQGTQERADHGQQ